MTMMEAIEARHSVRQYRSQPLAPEAQASLGQEVRACNQESGLHIQLVLHEPRAFAGFLARCGRFSGVEHYFALVGKDGEGLEETCGYYGERLVLSAQRLGLNTCWVAATFRKVPGAYAVEAGERLCAVIALGYGANQGVHHRSKAPEEVAKAEGPMPDWFRGGVRAALLAPTAMNRQNFSLTLDSGGGVTAQAGKGSYSKIDLGIVKYHFEQGAGTGNFFWR